MLNLLITLICPIQHPLPLHPLHPLHPHLIIPVTIDYLYEASFLLVRTTQRMFPLGLCQYLEDQYVLRSIISMGPLFFFVTLTAVCSH